MQNFRMAGESLGKLLEGLKAWGTLWAPAEKQKAGVYTLEVLEDVSLARPEALRTIVSFKKLLLKPRFSMVRQSPGEPPRDDHENDLGPTVFFGAHACDIHALKVLDMIYLSNYVDPYYKRNRERLTLVGYGCMPDEQCFCHSMGTSNAEGGYDLFLTPLEGRYLVSVGSSRGDDIVRKLSSLFEPTDAKDTEDYLKRLRAREKAFTLSLDVADLPFILDLKKDDPVWEEIGKKCLCCGSCSIVCPTCSCFNVIDERLEGGDVCRMRSWDACLFRDYAMVAGGHNFRADRADRVRTRYYHKQEAFVREYGMPSCVGCGRCIDNCPTGINVVEVFKYVRGEL